MIGNYQYKGIFGKTCDYLKGALFLGLAGCTGGFGLSGSEQDGLAGYANFHGEGYESSGFVDENGAIVNVGLTEKNGGSNYDKLRVRASGNVEDKENYDFRGSIQSNILMRGGVLTQPLLVGVNYGRDLSRHVEGTTTVTMDAESLGGNVIIYPSKNVKLKMSGNSRDIDVTVGTTSTNIIDNQFSISGEFKKGEHMFIADLCTESGKNMLSTTSVSVGGYVKIDDRTTLSGIVSYNTDTGSNGVFALSRGEDDISQAVLDFLRSKEPSVKWYNKNEEKLDAFNLASKIKNGYHLILSSGTSRDLEMMVLGTYQKGNTGIIIGAKAGNRNFGLEFGVIYRK